MTNRTFLGILLIVSFSCGKSPKEFPQTLKPILRYRIDSVVVDPMGGRFSYLEYLLHVSDYC